MTPYYYPIIDPQEVQLTRFYKRLPLLQVDDFYYFFKSTQEITLYFDKFPIYFYNGSERRKAIEVGLAICIIPEQLIIQIGTFSLEDQNNWTVGGNITVFALDKIYVNNILITDVIDYKLTQRGFAKGNTRRRKIGT